MPMANESEKSHINTVQKSTNIIGLTHNIFIGNKSTGITQINIKRLNAFLFLREFGG
jgi:hypothetical protein